jgi:hypothetical protein
MSKPGFFVSATFVLIFTAVTPPWRTAMASPSPETELNPPAAAAEAGPAAESAATPFDENLAITPAPALDPDQIPRPKPPRYYPYHQALTFRAGRASDFPKLRLDDSVLGFQYLFPRFLSPKLEAGADLHEGGRGHVHIGVRWIYFERSYFRPSLKLALDHHIDAEDGMATLAHKENWYARGAGTLEFVVWNPYSLRLENELLINFDKTVYVATVGLSRGW